MDDIKAKIYALMQKTTANGCTEEEALLAAKKVQEMLNKYQLSLSDIKIKETATRTGEYTQGLKSHIPVYYCLLQIANFCDVKVWSHCDFDGTYRYKFFGLEHDVTIAEYVTKVIDWALLYDGDDYKQSERYAMTPKNKRAKILLDFRIGMAQRIGTRLKQMKDAQRFANQSSGRDLVIIKNAVVEEAYAKLNMHLRKTKAKGRSPDPTAYYAGAAAGDKFQLNTGVGAQTRSTERIE